MTNLYIFILLDGDVVRRGNEILLFYMVSSLRAALLGPELLISLALHASEKIAISVLLRSLRLVCTHCLTVGSTCHKAFKLLGKMG